LDKSYYIVVNINYTNKTKANTITSIIALVPAHNESGSIRDTIESLLSQTRLPDEIVIIPNGCTDDTADIAREYPVTVYELPKLAHRKSEALNRAWVKFGQSFDLVISMDADTVFPSNAVADWEQEFLTDEDFGGSTSKFTVQQPGFFGRLQKAEYSSNIQMGLNRGWTNVLAGAGSAFSGAAMRILASRIDRIGPWSYESAVEDYEITYRLRELKLSTKVSPTVRAYTDGMKDLKSLWGQRMKWQTGTLYDLLRFGLNRLTLHDWMSQAKGLLIPLIRLLWVGVMILAIALDSVAFVWWGWLIPLLYIALNIKSTLRIPHRDKWDMVLAVTILPMEFLQCIQGGWIFASWIEVAKKAVTKKERDLWAAQYKAEGI